MSPDKYTKIAIKYRVDDLPGAVIPGSRLSKILNQFESAENNFTEIVLNYLHQQGLLALLQYSKREISFTEFQILANREQPIRRLATKATELEKLKKQELIQKAIAAKIEERQRITRSKKIAFENTPRFKARKELNNLKNEYGLCFFIEKEYFAKIMNIIRIVDKGKRLPEKEIVWLTTIGEEYFTQELKDAYHYNEAEHYADQFKKSENAWHAVNASSHYRKCSQPENSLILLNNVKSAKIKNKHLKSALCTTKGGCMRDLRNFQESIGLAKKAHNYDSKSFHPCTLLGAVNYELGNFTEGNLLFQKAETKGATTGSVDSELRSIYKRADKIEKDKLKQHLLQLDSHRYNWLKKTR